jgi:photosystem II stability/assembly factor-like uncharacterized protein
MKPTVTKKPTAAKKPTVIKPHISFEVLEPAFLPERPKRKFPAVMERARWFGERAGSLPESASLARLLGALRQAEETPDAMQDAMFALHEGLRLLHECDHHAELRKSEVMLADARARILRAKVVDRKERPSIGAFGPIAVVDQFEAPWAVLAIPVDPDALPDLDLGTALLVRRGKNGEGGSLVEASGFSTRDGLLVGRITRPGTYHGVALPRNPWLLLTIETLCLYWPWLRVEPALRKNVTGFGKRAGLVPKICQLILCAPEMIKAGELGELDRLGLGIPPDLPERLGRGSICDFCLDGLVDIGRVDGGIVIEPPELKLYRWPKHHCHRWTSIGPVPGSGFWGIGRVTQLDIHPTNGDSLIAGTAGGGVWRTDDAGLHWRPLMETQPTLTIGGVAFAASNAQVMYAASGEDGGGWNPAWPGVGVYRSANGGATWTLMAPVPSTRFSAVVVHPTQPNTVYAAGNQGLHKSTDGGQTWIINPGLASLFDGPITDIVIAHDTPDRIYVGVANDGVYRSTTGGEVVGGAPAFTRLDGPNQLPSGGAAGWIKLAIGRNGASGSSFLAAKLGPNGSRIFTTIDGGTVWTEQAQNVATVSFDEWASVIAVNPQDESRLYAGAAGQLKRSDDGGASWVSVATGIHPDQQDLVFNPNNPNQIYLANDGGVYQSVDAGASWAFASGNMRTTQLYDLDICQRDADVVGCGAQDNGVYYRTVSGLWRHLPFGWDGTQAAVDPTDPAILYFSGQNGISNGNLSRSIDGGLTVTALGTAGLSGGSPWVTLIKLDPTDPIASPATSRVLFVCGFNQLFRSTDGGASWQRVNDAAGNPFTTEGTITALEFAPGDPSVLYLGTSSGALYRGTGGGGAAASWTRIDTVGTEADALFPNTQIAAIGIDSNDKNHVWIGFAGNGVSFTSRPEMILNPLGISHAFKTTDGGTNWEDASGRFAPLHLPDVPTSAVAVDNLDRDVAYVGTDVGVFRSSDGGTTWTAFQEGLARSPVTELRLHRNRRTLFAATMGRGVYTRRLM